MKNNKRVTRRILKKEDTQSNRSETTVRCNNPDLFDHTLNRIHPVLGYLGDILQSSGKPYSKMEAKQSGLGQTIVEQVKSVNQSVEEIIKQNVKVPNQLVPSKSEQKFQSIPRPVPRFSLIPKPKHVSPAPIRGHISAPQVKFAAYPDVKTVTQPREETPVINYPQMEQLESMMPPPPTIETTPTTTPEDPNNPYASLPDQP